MIDTTVATSLAAFTFIIGLLVLLRVRNSKFEIKSTDIVVAVLPIVIFLLVTGKIQKFEVGELKIETAFIKASTSSISSQVTPLTGLPFEPVRSDSKSAVEQIPRLIEKKTECLSFRLGHGGYFGPAIREYLTLLARHPFLKYVLLENQDGSFFAIADARALTDLLTGIEPSFTADEFARWLNRSDTTSLKKLPRFISAESAVTERTDKTQALQLMESLNADTLPVIDKNGRFVGIVNRSRLTASLIVDVAKALKE